MLVGTFQWLLTKNEPFHEILAPDFDLKYLKNWRLQKVMNWFVKQINYSHSCKMYIRNLTCSAAWDTRKYCWTSGFLEPFVHCANGISDAFICSLNMHVHLSTGARCINLSIAFIYIPTMCARSKSKAMVRLHIWAGFSAWFPYTKSTKISWPDMVHVFSWSKVIKLLSCSTQLSMEIFMLIKFVKCQQLLSF